MSDSKNKKPAILSRKPYRKPRVVTEKLTAVAAVCNGTATAGRKATGPSPCNLSKLKS